MPSDVFGLIVPSPEDVEDLKRRVADLECRVAELMVAAMSSQASTTTIPFADDGNEGA